MPFYGDFLVQLGVVSQDQLATALADQTDGRLRLGELAVSRRLLTAEQVGQARRIQHSSSGHLADRRLGEILVALGFLSQPQVDEIHAEQREGWRKVGDILVGVGAVREDAHESYLRDFLHLEMSRRRRLDRCLQDAPHPYVVGTLVDLARSLLPRFGLSDCKVTDVRDRGRMRPQLDHLCCRTLHGGVDVILALSTSPDVVSGLRPPSVERLDELTQTLSDQACTRLIGLDLTPQALTGGADEVRCACANPEADPVQVELTHGFSGDRSGHSLMTLVTLLPS